MRNSKFHPDEAAQQYRDAYKDGLRTGSTTSLGTHPFHVRNPHNFLFGAWHGVLHDAWDRGYTDGQAQRRRELEKACSELNPSASDMPPPPPPLPPPGRPNTSAVE